MHFYERRKQKFVYIHLFVLARRFYCFLKNFPNVGYDILERGYRYIFLSVNCSCRDNLKNMCTVLLINLFVLEMIKNE